MEEKRCEVDTLMYQGLVNPEITKCRLCKCDIIRDQSNRKYCHDCSKIQTKMFKAKWEKLHYKKRFKVRICPICTTVFKTSVARKRYCTKSCYINNQNIQRMERQILTWQEKIRGIKSGI